MNSSLDSSLRLRPPWLTNEQKTHLDCLSKDRDFQTAATIERLIVRGAVWILDRSNPLITHFRILRVLCDFLWFATSWTPRCSRAFIFWILLYLQGIVWLILFHLAGREDASAGLAHRIHAKLGSSYPLYPISYDIGAQFVRPIIGLPYLAESFLSFIWSVRFVRNDQLTRQTPNVCLTTYFLENRRPRKYENSSVYLLQTKTVQLSHKPIRWDPTMRFVNRVPSTRQHAPVDRIELSSGSEPLSSCTRSCSRWCALFQFRH